MKVLVIGGTRFFGLEVVRMLAGRGDEVVVLSRREAPELAEAPVRCILGPRSDRAALEAVGAEAARRPFDAVFDNVAMDAGDVAAILDVLSGRVGQYVLTSTGSVYFARDHSRPVAEQQWEPHHDLGSLQDEGASPYGLGKRRAERTLHVRGGEVGSFTILRPTFIFGPGDPTGRLAWYVNTLLDGMPVGPMEFVSNPVFSRDAARLVVQVLDSPPPSGRCYNVAGREVVSLRDLCIRIQGILKIPGPGQAMPGQPRTPPPMPPEGRFVMDTERLLGELRFEPTPLGSWLELTAGFIQQERERGARALPARG
ncbi:MAG: NAD-dependent epimerase/dehydratase family protein [Candidatus Riflebacteria bacterium]|nr:NAD-dependent epimerase/dehydratase family protein [Candidatus Riflebacteria bacterium]